jgi:hypothetical protein
MTDEPKPSIWTRIVQWLLNWLKMRDAQQAANTAQEQHLKDETHAIQQAQASAPASVSDFVRRVQRGDAL